MTLTDRAAFDALAERLRHERADLRDGTRWVVNVGISECSISKGANDTYSHLRLQLEESGLAFSLSQVGCGGWCWAEPFVTVSGPGVPRVLYGPVTSDRVPELVAAMQRGVVATDLAVGTYDDTAHGEIQPLSTHPFFKQQTRVLLEHAGEIDPESIEDYIAVGGYSAWAKVLFDMTPEAVIDEMKTASVRGRGGAGFPAGIKWESARQARANPKYVAINSHEGEPNVYKDRRIIESNPHMILEGILIACYAVDAHRGYNYVGGEHVMALDRFRKAVAQAEALGLVGDNVLGTGFDVEVRTRAGGGAYICGEGSALMYSVMGERGQPRTKPPRSVEEGLWRRPTMLNNTESIANVSSVINRGGEWFAAMGTERSRGTKLMTMQGPLKRLGLVEMEMGVNLHELVFDVFGGMQEGKTFKGIQTGGVSAGPLLEHEMDVPVDFDSMTKMGGMLGSGGFVIFDETVGAVEFARYLTAFNRYESCSKCTPCRLGNPALVEILDRMLNGLARPGDLQLLERSSKHIIELSLCGLGQVAPMPLLGFMSRYRAEFEALVATSPLMVNARPQIAMVAAG